MSPTNENSAAAMDLDKENIPEDQSKPAGAEKSDSALLLGDIKQTVQLLERAVATREVRYTTRALRFLPSIRKRITPDLLKTAVATYLPDGSPASVFLQKFIGEGAPVDGGRASKRGRVPEVEVYLELVTLIFLMDRQRLDEAVEVAGDIEARIDATNRRTMYTLVAKVHFYYSRAYELVGRLAETRKTLYSNLRTCTLHHDDEGQATLINLLLHNYIYYSLYSQAQHLVARSTFPEYASSNEWARYLYYLGRISAIQLNYSEAHEQLEQALRKAPQSSAPGFQQAVYKSSVIVSLLLGQIPDRSIFRQPVLHRPLRPYSKLTQAVRTGDLVAFNKTVEQYAAKFQADSTYTLILRLRHNVIKTGVRIICQSYSRISLQDLCTKLHLGTPEDAEYIVAKAIRDGVVNAVIDHENMWIRSKDLYDAYCTQEPQIAFNQRIQFCLNVHNESVKAMRYPSNNSHQELETLEERRIREQQEKEWAQEMADEEDY